MKRFSTLLVCVASLCAVAFLSLSVSGCTTPAKSPDQAVTAIDTAARTALNDQCDNGLKAYVAIQAAAAFDLVSKGTAAKAATAWAVLEPLCDKRQAATGADVLIAAANAYRTLSSALAAAKT